VDELVSLTNWPNHNWFQETAIVNAACQLVEVGKPLARLVRVGVDRVK
jgi:hypothetical protein